MNYRSYSDMSNTIRNHLPQITDQGFDLIVGIPRSGILPAYMIALNLNISVCSLNDLINNNLIKRDGGRYINRELTYPSEATKILLVDDSYDSGNSLRRNLKILSQELRDKIKILAVYYASSTEQLDFGLEQCTHPRIFEWNIFHHQFVSTSCFDMDGVICKDPTDEENDDGENYENFILNAQPKFIPTYVIKTIVTSRLSKYRNLTEQWLSDHGVKYENLVMLSGYTAKERAKLGLHASFKAAEYEKSDYNLFFESNPSQAKEISKLTGKPVYCVDTNEMFNESKVEIKENNPTIEDQLGSIKRKLRNVVSGDHILYMVLKYPYRIARFFYHRIFR